MKKILFLTLTTLITTNAFAQLKNLEHSYKGIKIDSIRNLNELPIQAKIASPATTWDDFNQARDESFTQRNILMPSLLREEKYAEVISYIENLVEKTNKDISTESTLANEIYSTYVLDESYLPYLNKLITSQPKSYISHLLRAGYYGGRLYRVRTGEFTNNVKDEQIKQMEEFFVLADADIKKSQALNSKFVHTYLVKHFYEKYMTDSSLQDNLGSATQLSPSSYYLWYSILEFSAPRWSRSSNMTKTALSNIKNYYTQNPKLKSLQSFEYKELGDQARFAKADSKAMELYAKGLEIGYHPFISLEVARLLSARGDWKDACIFTADALDQAPYLKQAILDQAECIKVKKRGIIQ